MFLIDELNQLYSENDNGEVFKDSVNRIHKALLGRLDFSSDSNFFNTFKSTNFTYKQFCKDHHLMKPDGFEITLRDFIMSPERNYNMEDRIMFLNNMGINNLKKNKS